MCLYDLGMPLSLLLNVTSLVSWDMGDACYFLLAHTAPAHHNYFFSNLNQLNPFKVRYCVLYRVLCYFHIFSYTVRYHITHSCPSAQKKVVWRSGKIAPHILNLGTRLRWMVGLMLLPFYHPPREKVQSTCWRGGWVEPRASLYASVKRQVTCFSHTLTTISWLVNP